MSECNGSLSQYTSFTLPQNVSNTPIPHHLIAQEWSNSAGVEEVHANKGNDVATVEPYVEAFRSKMSLACTLPATERESLLTDAFESCRPPYLNPWMYSLRVIEYLAEQSWDSMSFIGRIWSFHIPPAAVAETMGLLDCLVKLAKYYPQHRMALIDMYCQIAAKAVHGGRSTGIIHDKDILKMIQQLWHLVSLENTSTGQVSADTLTLMISSLRDRYVRRPLLSILSSLEHMEHRLMLLIIRASEQEVLRSAAVQVLQCLPQTLMETSFPHITEQLIGLACKSKKISRSVSQHRIQTWFGLLHQLETSMHCVKATMPLVDEVVSHAERCVFASKASARSQLEQILVMLVHRFSIDHLNYGPAKHTILRTIDVAIGAGMDRNSSVPTLPETLAILFARLQQNSLPFQELLDKLVGILTDRFSHEFVINFLVAMHDQEVPIHATDALDRLYTAKTGELVCQDLTVSEQRRQRFAYTLRTCQRILDVLNKFPSTWVAANFTREKKGLDRLQTQYQLEHILQRAHANSALPLIYRKVNKDASIQMHVALIHQLAHQYSEDTSLSQRGAWRAIYYLYRYLRDNKLPIGPLFTKAVVRTSIIRPMSEQRFVSARRLIWVCHRVAEVEGKAEAEKIEHLFWQWRGDMIKQAKSMHMGLGGDRREKARIGSMKRLGLLG